MKKSALVLTPFLILVLCLLSWVFILKPAAISWAKKSLPAYIQKEFGLDFQFQEIKISLAQLQLEVENFQISSQDFENQKVVANRLTSRLNFFALLVGRISISSLTLSGLHAEVNVPLSSAAQTQKQVKQKTDALSLQKSVDTFFELLPKIPIERINILASSLKVTVEKKILDQANLFKNFSNIFQIKLDQISLLNAGEFVELLQGKIAFEFIESKKQNSIDIQFSKISIDSVKSNLKNLKIFHLSSFVEIDATIKSYDRVFSNPEINFVVSSQINLSEIQELASFALPPKLKTSVLRGSVNVSGRSQFKSLAENTGSLNLKTENVEFDNFALGSASILANLQNNTVTIDQIDIQHPSGRAQLSKISFEQKSPFLFKAIIRAQDFSLQKLFKSIDLQDIPVELLASGGGSCSGQLSELRINCQAQLTVPFVDVKTDLKDSFSIVRLSNGSVSGDITFTQSGLTYKALARIQDSPFESSGEVEFLKGFNMNFSSAGLELKKVDDLAGLELRGILKGQLKTSGDSSGGIIQADLESQNFEISGFKIGNLKSKFIYEKGLLSFLDLNLKRGASPLNGNLVINVLSSRISGDFKSTQADLFDLNSMLPEKLAVPFLVSGKGMLNARFSGPLDFWKLSSDIQAEFSGVQIAGERFDHLHTKIFSDGNKIEFKETYLLKTPGKLLVTGQIITNEETPRLDIEFSSAQLRFEESNYLNELFQNSNGDLFIEGQVESTINNPLVNAQVSIRDNQIETVSVPDSQVKLVITKSELQVQSQLFGRQIQSEVRWPLNDSGETVIKAQIRDLNPLFLLPFISLPIPNNDTIARLSGQIDLKIPSRNINKMNGTVQIDDMLLQRSSQSLKLQKSSRTTITNGRFKFDPLYFVGPDQWLKLQQTQLSANQSLSQSLSQSNSVAVTTTGRLSLRPFQFLVPFAENLSGFSEFQFVTKFLNDKLSFSGEGLLDQATLGIKGFNYPLRKVSAYFDFSQSKIIFSEINAEINQSVLKGLGYIEFKDSKNVIVNLNANSKEFSIEFPPKYLTAGQVQILVHGNWPPYTLKVDYNINDGLITEEFGEQNNRVIVTTPNRFLPPKNLEQQKPSLYLDVAATFLKGVIVKNRIMEGIATGEINVSGSPSAPELKGVINLETGSKVFFKDKPFEIQTGKVVFLGGKEINPNVLISADARVSDYDINLIVKGSGKNITIEPTSQPALPRNDIFSLLALGYTETKLDQSLSSDLQQQQTGLEILANISNQSQINKSIQEKLGLNVQLAPSIDSTRNIAVPKVVLSKQLGKKINTSYSRPLTGDRQNNEIRLQWLFQPNWSLIMNYQNQTNEQNSNSVTPEQTDKGVGGLDLEFKKEFK